MDVFLFCALWPKVVLKVIIIFFKELSFVINLYWSFYFISFAAGDKIVTNQGVYPRSFYVPVSGDISGLN